MHSEPRLFANNGYTRLATSNGVTVQGPPPANLSASPSSVSVGGAISAAWDSILAPTATDWIGLYSPGAADNAFIAWAYTNGNASGSVPLTVPVGTPTGSYELRLFYNNGYAKLATSNSVTVQLQPAAALSVSPTTVYSGHAVTATWGSIFAPSATDWIGLFATGAADNVFIAWQYTDGNAAGSGPFTIPATAAAGSYELRLFSNNSAIKLATSNTVTVQGPPPATLSASPSAVALGGTLTAAWTSILAPTATDWVGLYATGAADNAFIAWVYTNGNAAGNVPLTVPANAAAGSYELRLFYNNGYAKLATSNTVSVGAVVASMYFIHTDHLNTPRLIADAAQTTVWKWEQGEPFGDSAANEDPDGNSVNFEFNLRFPGQYFDKETKLAYNYFRDYDSTIGRYVQSDPLGIVTTRFSAPTTGINHLYAYAKSSPLLFIDPSGLKPYDFQIGYGGGIGHVIVGGSVYTATIKDAQTGETCSYQIRCVGLGVGLPEAGVTSKPARFDDGQACSTCKDFTGLGYIGGASGQVGGGVTIGGGVKIPNGPFIANDILGLDYGAFRIGVSHSACYFSLQ